MTDLSGAPDAALVEDTRRGREEAFAELVKRHQALVGRTVSRLLGRSSETEDAVQEVFLRVYSALHRFDPRCPFEPWIVRIASNYCIDQLRQHSRRQRVWVAMEEKHQEQLIAQFSRNGDFEAGFNEDPESYEKAAQLLLLELPAKIRAAFVLREVERLEYADVARALNTSPLAARVRVSRARKALQKSFQQYLAKLPSGKRK